MHSVTGLAVLTATILFTALFAPTCGHGMMCEPRQRGAYISTKCGAPVLGKPAPDDVMIDHCAHCLNGGTAGSTRKNLPSTGWQIFDPINDFEGSARRAGLCGDPLGRNDHMIGGSFMPYRHVPIVAHYKTGAEVDFVAELDTNHNGYFEFFLCSLDDCGEKDIKGVCFKKNCHRLLRVPHPDCERPSRKSHYECGPIDPAQPSRWYLPCRQEAHVGVQIVGGQSGTMRYKLPEGVSCKHCVMQWYWATANSCAPPGYQNYIEKNNFPFGRSCESDGGGRGKYRAAMAPCGGTQVPEEFWSCADVQITPDGRSAGDVLALSEPVDSPHAHANDEEEVRANPTSVVNKAMAELKKNIALAANESPSERKTDERRAANGECVLEDNPCDGTTECCDVQQVCVYTRRAGGFSCRFWWSLWDEVEHRENNNYN